MVLAHHHFEQPGMLFNFLCNPDRSGYHHARTQQAAATPRNIMRSMHAACISTHAPADMVHGHACMVPRGAAHGYAISPYRFKKSYGTNITTVRLSVPLAGGLRLEPDYKRGRLSLANNYSLDLQYLQYLYHQIWLDSRLCEGRCEWPSRIS
jgi:hypothetical protein